MTLEPFSMRILVLRRESGNVGRRRILEQRGADNERA
jgi:hypothetical protein